MDRNLEQWLRGEPVQPETVGDSNSEGMADDVAALLGLPVAVSRIKNVVKDEDGSSAGQASTENTLSEPDIPKSFPSGIEFPPLVPDEIQFGGYFPREDVNGEYEESAAENGEDESAALGYGLLQRVGEEPDLSGMAEHGQPGQEEPVSAVGLPVEGVPFWKMGRRKRMAAAGMAAAAVAVGAYFLFGRESTGELLLKGREHSRGGNYAQALVYYNRAAEKNPIEFDALLGIAESLEGLDRKGEAVDAYYRCLQVAPGDPRVHARLGFLLFSMSSYDNAIRSFQESVNFDPSNAGVFAGLGRAYEAKADYVQAVSAFKKALDLDPSSEEYRSALGRVETALSVQNEEAERRERSILAKEKVLLGRGALALNDLDESRNRFLQALDLVPDDHDALMGLGDVKKTAGDMEGAAGYYRAVLEFHPGSSLAAAALAEAEKALSALSAETKPVEGMKKGEPPEVKNDAAASAAGKETPEVKKKPKAGTKTQKTLPSPPAPKKKPAPAVRPRQKGQPQALLQTRPAAGDSVSGFRGRTAGSHETSPVGQNIPGGEKSLKASKRVFPAEDEPPESLAGMGIDQLRRGNYASAFSIFWKRMLQPSSRVPETAGGGIPLFAGAPFSKGRWREISPVENGPLEGSIPLSVPLPCSGETPARWARDKAPLMEAVALNPKEGTVYLNLAMSYILRKNEKGQAIVFGDRDEEEQAVYYSLLAHAWLRNGERDKAVLFINAAKRRARGELLGHVLALESFFLGRENRET